MAEDLHKTGDQIINKGQKGDNELINQIEKFMARADDQKMIKEKKYLAIRDIYEKQFETTDSKNTRVIEGQLLFETFWRSIAKAKPLNYFIRNDSINESLLEALKIGVQKVLSDGGYVRQLTKQKGAFQDQYLFGDAFIQFGADPEEGGDPIVFSKKDIRRVWVDPLAEEARGSEHDSGIREIAILARFPKDSFERMFPDFKDKVLPGDISVKPASAVEQNDDEYNRKEEQKVAAGYIEAVYYYNLYQQRFAIIAGKSPIVIKNLEKEKYPYTDIYSEKPVIPVLKRGCFPSIRGIYGFGLGDLFYKLHNAERKNENMAFSAARDRVDPIQVIPLAKGNIKGFTNWLRRASEARNHGKKGIIPIETDAAGREKFGKIQSLVGDGMGINEYTVIAEAIDRKVKRAGINLDILTPSGRDTAREAILREEASNEFVLQIQEFNAPEDQFAIEQAIKSIHDLVDKDNDTPIAGNVKMIMPDGTMATLDELVVEAGLGKRMTLGVLSDILRQHGLKAFTVEMDIRSGANPSLGSKLARIDEILPALDPTGSDFKENIKTKARLLGISLKDEGISEIPQQGGGVAPAATAAQGQESILSKVPV